MSKSKAKPATAAPPARKGGDGGRITKPAAKVEKAKTVAKAVVAAAAAAGPVKPSKAKEGRKKKPVEEDSDEETDSSGEEESSSDEGEDSEAEDSSEESDSDEGSDEDEDESSEGSSDEDDDEEESDVPTKKSVAKTNGVKPATAKPTAEDSSSEEEDEDSGSDGDSDEEESEESEAKPTTSKEKNLKTPAKKAKESSEEESGSEDESSEEEDDDDEDEDDDDDDDDEEDDEEEEEKPAKPVESQKRKQPTAATPPAKRIKAETNASGGSTSIFVGNLSWNIDQDWLASIFESIGGVVSARIVTDRDSGRPKGFGYVDFETPEHAQNALELKGQEVDGRAINVDIAQQRAEKTFDSPKERAARFGDKISEASSTLFVGNMSFNSSQDELYELFGQTGQVVSVRIPTDKETGQVKGFAYVEFVDVNTAKAALEQFQGHLLNSRPLRLDFSTPRDNSNASPGGGRGGFGGRRGGFGGGFGGGRGGRGGGRPGLGARGGRGGGGGGRGGFNSFQGKKTTF